MTAQQLPKQPRPPAGLQTLRGSGPKRVGMPEVASIRRLLGNQGPPRLHPGRMGHTLSSMDRGLCGTKMGLGQPESGCVKGAGRH